MPHHTSLIAMLCAGFVLAFFLGLLAHRLRLSPIVGYLLAGVIAGPYTPGFVGDQTLAPQLAEIGVILLMFGVGLHFSLGDLIAVRKVAAATRKTRDSGSSITRAGMKRAPAARAAAAAPAHRRTGSPALGSAPRFRG